MDSTDKSILQDLIAYCRVTYQELALKHGISANAIKKRVNKMLETGIIEEFYIELSLAMVDAEMVMCLAYTDGSEDEEVFIEQVGNNLAVSTIGKASGNMYIIFAACSGAKGLSEMGSFLRNLAPVKQVELHPVIFFSGKKIQYSPVELMVLRQLTEDPRMSISEIAKRTGITARTARKTVDGIREGGGLIFGVHFNPNVSGILFLARIHWDEKETNLGELLAWLQKRFPLEYFHPIISATNPLMFASFVVEDLKTVQEISKEIRKKTGVTKVVTILGEPNHFFPDIKKVRLEELINEAGF